MEARPDIERLLPVQEDALKEVVNIGSGQAATTLAVALGVKVLVSVPAIGISSVEEVLSSLAKPTNPVVSLVNIFAGDIAGCTIWLMPGDKAREFADLSWHHMPQAKKQAEFNFGQIHREISDVLTGAYLNTVENMLNLMTVPSTPMLMSGVMRNVLEKILADRSQGTGMVSFIQNKFTLGEKPQAYTGFFMMVPDFSSLKRMLEVLNVAEY
jgi:chemotaxis protein CheC